MDGTGDHQVKRNKPELERQMLHVFSYTQNLDCFLKKYESRKELFGRVVDQWEGRGGTREGDKWWI
jgi:hypothetical protein